jgi:SAM-dependent methyltransferase
MTPYDQVAYPGVAYPFATPDRMSVFATLHGLLPTLPTEATVLELGCGDGANLLAIAQRFPSARCIGVDASESALAVARRRAAACGLTNVDLHRLDLAAFAGPGPLPPCDYVIAHGLLSWVAPAVRDRILTLVGQVLKPSGVAMLSFLTFPGQHDLEPLRALMRHHVANVHDPKKRIDQARDIALWQLDRTRRLHGEARAKLMHDIVLEWHQMPDAVFLHDLLADERHPLTLSAMASEAERAGLQWLANARMNEPRKELLPESLRDLVREVQDPIRRQSYLDCFLMTRFRTSLFARASTPVQRSAKPTDFASFFATSIIPRAQLPDVQTVVVETPVGSIRLSPEATMLLRHLADHRPNALALSTLGDPEVVGLAASELWLAEAVDLTLVPPALAPALSNTPTASPLARLLAAERRETVTTLWHREVPLDEEAAAVLAACDGVTTAGELDQDLLERFHEVGLLTS